MSSVQASYQKQEPFLSGSKEAGKNCIKGPMVTQNPIQ